MTDLNIERTFLTRYLRYDELTRLVRGWAGAHPEFVRLQSLTKTAGGRDVWLIEIGRNPERTRPAICIDANMHAAELLGTNAALAVADRLIGLHKRMDARMPRTVREAAIDGLYYIIPSISPDGAEDVMTAGRVSRSAPRLRRKGDASPHWVRRDMDGDGKIRQLRFQHPAGEFVAHPEFDHVMVPRTIGDEGPYFKIFPEGLVEGYDGIRIPFPGTLSDNDSDFNRNFPFGWSGGCEGAGQFPGWEPETNAIVEFASRAPHIFAWLNLHTFGGVFIRPPFDASHQIAPGDLELYDYVAELAAVHTGMPTIEALKDMTPDPTKPMTGTLAAWAYGDRGCLAWPIELWDLFAAAGLAKREPFFVNYATQGRREVKALVRWDIEQNEARTFGPWRPFHHPQFGEVELGGLDTIHGFINPPTREIAGICDAVSSFAVTLMALRPNLNCHVKAERISETLTRIDLFVTNDGYLPTYITNASVNRPWNSGLKILAEASGCTLVSGQSSTDLGHLPGWGRGANHEANGPFFQKSQGVYDVLQTWIVAGPGQLDIQVGAPRIGWHHCPVTVGK